MTGISYILHELCDTHIIPLFSLYNLIMPGYTNKKDKKESFSGEPSIADVISSSPVHTILAKMLKKHKLILTK